MNPYFEEQQRQQAKKRQEQLEKRAERDLPFDIAKYQHELARSLLQEQHELNLDIHGKQAKLTKFTTYMTISATILAALLGVGLGWYLSTKSEAQLHAEMQLEQPLTPKKTVQEQAYGETSLPLPHKETGESSGQVANTLKNVSSVTPN